MQGSKITNPDNTCMIINNLTEQKKPSFIKYVFWIILDLGAHSITSRYVCSIRSE